VKYPPEWADVLAAASRLQELVPDAVLVGGTAASQHVGHRVSFDDDHVLTDLRDRYDQVLAVLESDPGWKTARLKRPLLILGSLDGIETGIRQLIRRRPLEVERLKTPGGDLQIPTLAEMARIKAWLILRRNATRDYLDFVALADRLGEIEAVALALGLDDYYADQLGEGGSRVSTQLAKQLAEPSPYDLSEVDLRHYRHLLARWQDWRAVAAWCRRFASRMLEAAALKSEPS
jgi:hypothetical protein